MRRRPLIFVIAGEPSGDQLGGQLIKGLKQLYDGQVNFAGISGEAMQAEGLRSLFPMHELSLMGVFGILRHLFRVLRRLKQTLQAIEKLKPDVVVTIDSQEFSYHVAKRVRAQRKGLAPRLVHYVATTVWAWRPGRAKKIAKVYDHLLALYPFEPPYFEKEGLQTTFVGHPLVKTPQGSKYLFRSKYGLPPSAKILCMLPGSRVSEVDVLLPIFKETVDKLRKKFPNLVIVIPTVPAVERKVRKALKHWAAKPIVILGEEEKVNAFAASHVALAASGTVAMQLALAQVPCIIAYKVGKVTEFFARRLLTTRWICMINILLQQTVIPEFLQAQCQPQVLANEIEKLLLNPERRDAQKRDMQKAIGLLYPTRGDDPQLLPAQVVAEEVSIIHS